VLSNDSVILGIEMTALFAVQALVLAVFAFLTSLVWFRSWRRPLRRSVAILVLGDVGRSPRMMYHAESFATLPFKTYMIGNKG
jgi:beta-1,4-mannosyltransferase